MMVVAVALAGSSVLGVGCAPAIYAARVGPASRAVERARLADAPTLAPYEYYYADACLHQARQDAGEAHYQDAIEYADAAREHAELALERTRASLRESGR
jgi:hypothetical protein